MYTLVMSEIEAIPAKARAVSMSVVLQRSGVTRQTVHFYLRKGLLPKPNRISRTYALYSPETVDLLKLIKECKSGLRLSLDEIVRIFTQVNYDPRQIRGELDRRNATPPATQGSSGSSGQALTHSDLLATLQTARPPHWLEDIRQHNFVHPRRGNYSSETTELIRSISDLSKLVPDLDEFEDLVKRIDEEADAELAALRHTLNVKGHAQADYTAAIRSLTLLDQFIERKRKDSLHNVFVHKLLRSAETIVGPNQKRVLPSETFLVKMGLNREIDRLLNCLDKDPEDRRHLRDLARAYNMRSDWLNLYGVSEKLLHLEPLDVRAIADLTRAMYYIGRIDEAVTLLEKRLESGSDALLKFRLGQSLVLRARDSGISEFFNAVIRKHQLTAEALREASDQPSTRRWITLDRILDDLSISDPLRLNQPTVEEVEALHSEYLSIHQNDLSALSKMGLAVGKMLAAFALHLVYRRHHDPRAERIRRKIVQADPHCVLATRSVQPSANNSSFHRGRAKASLERVG